MSTTTNGAFGASYKSRIAAIAPTARSVKSLQVSRTKRHSEQDARVAVAKKLRANLEYLRNPNSVEKPDLVYSVQSDGTYAVGIKYGNRWLEGVFDGKNHLANLTAEQTCELLEGFAEDALAGEFDQFIKPIMEANIAARNKA